MQITITSTGETQNNDPSNPGWRVWRGVTEAGTACFVFVDKISAATGLTDTAYVEFSNDLISIVEADALTALYARAFV